jgi:hypothetical protein
MRDYARFHGNPDVATVYESYLQSWRRFMHWVVWRTDAPPNKGGVQKISNSVYLLNACAHLYFQIYFQLWETPKDERMTDAQIEKCHQAFCMWVHKHGTNLHYFEALGSAGKQEWPLLRKICFWKQFAHFRFRTCTSVTPFLF